MAKKSSIEKNNRRRRLTKSPGLGETSDLPGALWRDTNRGGKPWAAEANQISDR